MLRINWNAHSKPPQYIFPSHEKWCRTRSAVCMAVTFILSHGSPEPFFPSFPWHRNHLISPQSIFPPSSAPCSSSLWRDFPMSFKMASVKLLATQEGTNRCPCSLSTADTFLTCFLFLIVSTGMFEFSSTVTSLSSHCVFQFVLSNFYYHLWHHLFLFL